MVALVVVVVGTVSTTALAALNPPSYTNNDAAELFVNSMRKHADWPPASQTINPFCCKFARVVQGCAVSSGIVWKRELDRMNARRRLVSCNCRDTIL